MGKDEAESYTIVGTAEADPTAGFISTVSPFGRALLNHKTGDTVVAKSPDGELMIDIITVS